MLSKYDHKEEVKCCSISALENSVWLVIIWTCRQSLSHCGGRKIHKREKMDWQIIFLILLVFVDGPNGQKTDCNPFFISRWELNISSAWCCKMMLYSVTYRSTKSLVLPILGSYFTHAYRFRWISVISFFSNHSG